MAPKCNGVVVPARQVNSQRASLGRTSFLPVRLKKSLQNSMASFQLSSFKRPLMTPEPQGSGLSSISHGSSPTMGCQLATGRH